MSKKDKEIKKKADELKVKKAKDEVVEKDEVEKDAVDETTDEATEDEATEEAKADEAESSEEETEDESTDEGEVAKGLDPIAVLKSIQDMEDPAEMREAIDSALAQLTKVDEDGNRTQADNIALDVVATLSKFQTQLNHIEALAKAQTNDEDTDTEAEKGEEEEDTSEEASAEEADSTEDKPSSDEASADETAEEEESEEESNEDIQKLEKAVVAKVDESLAKFSNELADMTKAVGELADKVKNLESQPVPSKIVAPSAIAKKFELDENSSERLSEIKTELNELENVLKSNPVKYQSDNLADKAFNLINERERLQSGI